MIVFDILTFWPHFSSHSSCLSSRHAFYKILCVSGNCAQSSKRPITRSGTDAGREGLAISTLIPAKGVKWGWGQGSVQANPVPLYQTHLAITLYHSIYAWNPGLLKCIQPNERQRASSIILCKLSMNKTERKNETSNNTKINSLQSVTGFLTVAIRKIIPAVVDHISLTIKLGNQAFWPHQNCSLIRIDLVGTQGDQFGFDWIPTQPVYTYSGLMLPWGGAEGWGSRGKHLGLHWSAHCHKPKLW